MISPEVQAARQPTDGFVWNAEVGTIGMRLTRRRRNGSERQIVILAPEPAAVPSAFQRVYPSPEHHAVFLAGLQRLRGEIYLDDIRGALSASPSRAM